MDKRDAIPFAQWMRKLAEIYQCTLTDSLSEIYWESWQPFAFEKIDQALRYFICNPDIGKYMPKPCDIIFLLEGSNADKALAAWTKVQKATRQVGSYRSVAFDDVLIHAVISDMGGWINLCRCKIDDLPFRAQEFQKRYLRYLVTQPKTAPSRLIGIEENNCRQFSLPMPEVKHIGQPTTALLLEDQSQSNSVTELFQPLQTTNLTPEKVRC